MIALDTALEGRLENACRSRESSTWPPTASSCPTSRATSIARPKPRFRLRKVLRRQGRPGPAVWNDDGKPHAPLGPWHDLGQHLAEGRQPAQGGRGLLTAENVTGLDLPASELVVLSACETVLGQVHVGEGVFSLRRAFVLAGTKTLVTSLWKVPDEPIRKLMEAFYGRLLAAGAALKSCGKPTGPESRYPAPFYWGTFICQGGPCPRGLS